MKDFCKNQYCENAGAKLALLHLGRYIQLNLLTSEITVAP